ncbi:HK97-gp10 family putative phage morphogenesis protein [Paraburkholderia bannensis]|uniref:HK97-gp10 family putative phage morphogenesis protein n=1 Tax=Paraburkholderia sp. SIMBA_027 TaxID=3085770 RepID=UPI0021A99645|nr:HK97-gp10 family putative phage morphogenesis protein [Paraburkholderia bannensis]
MAKLIEVSNPDGFSDMLRKMEGALGESAIRKAGAAAATVVLKEAQRRVPIGPGAHHQGSEQFPVGHGRDSLLVTFLPEKSVNGRQATYAVTWSASAYYLRFVEYGTSKMAAQPFFRPSIDATRLAQYYAVAQELDKAIAEAKIGER